MIVVSDTSPINYLVMLGIIERACRKGLLDLKTKLDELLQTNFRINKTIIQQVIDRNA